MKPCRENPRRLIPPNPTMSKFEKKTLCYAFLWSWLLILWPYPLFVECDRGFHLLIAAAGLLACVVLNAVFGLWGGGGPYYQENNLTEREKFLSYKATSRTLVVSVIVFWIAYSSATFYHKEWTVKWIDIGATFLTTSLVFMAVKSYVLFAFLRYERIQNPQA